jgi:tripartite-type tricarboxylate transporter receptor subunit TctC
MRIRRCGLLHLAMAAIVLHSFSIIAKAQTYPIKPVRIVNGFAAGGTADIIARLVSQPLSERLGQQIILENRTGAASNIATESIVRAPPDGYTLLLATPANAINATLYEKLNYKFIDDIAPVGSIARMPNVMEVNPSVPVKTVPEFIAYAKANPGKINMASGGAGSTPHVFGELFKAMTAIHMVHVPYRGAGPALTDLLGGQVQVMFDPVPSSLDHIRAGRLRGFAVTTATRPDALPDLPALAEFVPGYEASFWCGLGAPRNTPTEIVQRLNKELNAALFDSRMRSRFADLNAIALPGAPADFGKLIAEETEKWAKVVKFAGIKAE